MSLIIKKEKKRKEKKKIAEKMSQSTKISVQQTTDGEQPKKSAADQHRVREVICIALLVK